MALLKIGILISYLMAYTTVLYCANENHIGLHILHNITDEGDGKIISITTGDTIKLTLADKIDGGYHFDSIVYNKHILKLIKHTTRQPAIQNRPGNPGNEIWRFMAFKSGRSALKVTASRPWAQTDIIKIFSNIIIVKLN